MMKRIAAALALAVLATLCLNFNNGSRADQPIYGGIYSPYYVTTSKVLFLEMTQGGGVQGGPISLIPVTVSYQMKCTDGRGGDSGILADSFTFTTTGVGFEGAGKYFPCSGWLLRASFFTQFGPSAVPTGLDYAQLQILNIMPKNTGPKTSAGTETASNIEANVVCDFLHSNYIVTWPGQNCAPPSIAGVQYNQALAVTSPAAGANFAFALDLGTHHRII